MSRSTPEQPTVLYLDANALAKLYVIEEDSPKVVRAVEAVPNVAACAVAYAEVCGVFARYLRDGPLSEEAHDELTRAFAEDWATVSVIEVSPSVSRLAGQLLKAHRAARLRAMDARCTSPRRSKRARWHRCAS